MTQTENGAHLARQLQRLLARGRLSAMTLLLRNGRRVDVNQREQVRVRRARGTIEISCGPDINEILFEELLAIELRACATPEVREV